MIHSHRVLLAPLLILALFAASAHAQQSNTKTEDAEVAALREKAISLLQSVAGQLSSLQSAENRARLGANIADSLWPHDENRARELLQLVESDIRTELLKYDSRNAGRSTIMVFLKLRVDTVERIAKHDAQAALAFLKNTKPNSAEPLPKYADQSTEDIEIRLAQKVATDNPEAALALARESLDHGFSHQLVQLLRRLNRKHRESAQDLFKDVIQKLQRTDLLNDWTARYFAVNLANSFRPPAANESSYRDLMAVFVTSALKNGCAKRPTQEDGTTQFCTWMASEVPDMEKFDARAFQLRHWNRNSGRDSDRRVSFEQELFDVLEDGTTAAQVYWRLIERARMAGKFDEARKLANTLITDPEARRNMLAQLDNNEKKFEINEAMLAEMEANLEKIVQPLARASYLMSHAHRFGVADRTLALKLLGRAAGVIDTMKPGKDQTRAQLFLAIMYCYEKSDRGMAMMESLVPKLNELVDVAARLDGFDTNYLRDGEWNMSANGAVGDLLTTLSQFAGSFAWRDLDRAVSLASGFDRPEIRMMAHVKLAQGILAGPAKRLPVAQTRY
jgi:hypothetical protein